MSAWRLAAAATFALLALQWAWRWADGPAAGVAFWIVPTLFSLPLLPPALGFARRQPRAPLWAGIAALFYFCHGVAELRAGDDPVWSWAEIVLSLAIVLVAGWPGIAAKLARRRAAAPPNV